AGAGPPRRAAARLSAGLGYDRRRANSGRIPADAEIGRPREFAARRSGRARPRAVAERAGRARPATAWPARELRRSRLPDTCAGRAALVMKPVIPECA